MDLTTILPILPKPFIPIFTVIFNYLSITEKRYKTLKYYLNDKKITEINIKYKTNKIPNQIEDSFILDLSLLNVKKYNNNNGLEHPLIYSLSLHLEYPLKIGFENQSTPWME